jgi:hypothetical protein
MSLEGPETQWGERPVADRAARVAAAFTSLGSAHRVQNRGGALVEGLAPEILLRLLPPLANASVPGQRPARAATCPPVVYEKPLQKSWPNFADFRGSDRTGRARSKTPMKLECSSEIARFRVIGPQLLRFVAGPPYVDRCQHLLTRGDLRLKPGMDLVAINVDVMRGGLIDTRSCLAGSRVPASPVSSVQ